MKLYLHIGMHKTGSTSLQNSLLDASDELNKKGWGYISTNPHGNSSVFIDINDKNNGFFCNVNEKMNDAIRGVEHKNKIMSGEHFFAINELSEIYRLHSMLREVFDEIVVLIYLRRQDKMAVSFKQQATKGNMSGIFLSSIIFGHSSKCIPECTDSVIKYLDYKEKIKKWSEVFGKENLIVTDFDNLYGNDICLDFAYKVNLPIELKSIRINEGVSRLSSLVLHKLLDARVVGSYVGKVRAALKGRDDDKVLPRREDAINFYRFFHESNSYLHHYGVFFSDDFSNYPEDEEYTFKASDADIIVDALSKIKIGNVLSEKDVDALRDIAVSLEEKNVDAAYNIMKIVKKLRPHGPLIERKIKGYKSKMKNIL